MDHSLSALPYAAVPAGWREIAERQYLDLTDDARELVDARLAQLEHDPSALRDALYDAASDQWSATLGDRGFVLCAIVTEPPTVIVLRLVVLL